MKAHDIQVRQTAKFLIYVLGRHPDEFGLIPDADGFVPIKILLKAMHEEQGWRHLRDGHLTELCLHMQPAPIEIQNNRVRCTDRSRLPAIIEPAELPKLLYTTVRQRAYPVVLEKGIPPSQGPHVVLCADPGMAERLGRRIDNHPVMLTVQVGGAPGGAGKYRQYGNVLFLTDHVPVGEFSGPALPREKTRESQKTKPDGEVAPAPPGSYFPDPSVFQAPRPAADKSKRAHRKKAWQTERRQARRQKHNKGE